MAQEKLKAQEYLNQWESLAPHIQNGFLQAFAKDLTDKVDAMDGDFHLSKDLAEGELAWKGNTKKLQTFLARRAMVLTQGNHKKAARLLGITRQTLHNLIASKSAQKPTPPQSADKAVGAEVELT